MKYDVLTLMRPHPNQTDWAQILMEGVEYIKHCFGQNLAIIYQFSLTNVINFEIDTIYE